VSTTLDRLAWNNSTLLHGDVAEEVANLKNQPGNGKRRSAEGTTPTALELIDTKTTSRGVVVHTYQPSGKPQYGSVTLEQEGDVVRGTRPVGGQRDGADPGRAVRRRQDRQGRVPAAPDHATCLTRATLGAAALTPSDAHRRRR
jgi:hypothetical protein